MCGMHDELRSWQLSCDTPHGNGRNVVEGGEESDHCTTPRDSFCGDILLVAKRTWLGGSVGSAHPEVKSKTGHTCLLEISVRGGVGLGVGWTLLPFGAD